MFVDITDQINWNLQVFSSNIKLIVSKILDATNLLIHES